MNSKLRRALVISVVAVVTYGLLAMDLCAPTMVE